MAIRSKDIYDGRKKSRFHFGVTIIVILAVIVVAILIFYWLRGYAVYDENGNATIVMPWSQKAATESPVASPPQSTTDSSTELPPENTTDTATEIPTENNADSSAPSLPDSTVVG